MDNTIYIALSRQTGLFRALEVASNNIANANTDGYSSQKLVFNDFLVDNNRLEDAYVNDPSTYRDTSAGSIKTTGNPYDLAINGAGYFQVATPLGTRYTRAGNFQVDADGTIVNISGYPVLGTDGGEVTVPTDARDVTINGAGQVIVDGQDVGQVGVVEFANEQALRRAGNTLFSATETPVPTETARVVQGGIESSNVSPVTELVNVTSISRSVANTAKLIETMYDLQRKVSSVYTRSQTT